MTCREKKKERQAKRSRDRYIYIERGAEIDRKGGWAEREIERERGGVQTEREREREREREGERERDRDRERERDREGERGGGCSRQREKERERESQTARERKIILYMICELASDPLVVPCVKADRSWTVPLVT